MARVEQKLEQIFVDLFHSTFSTLFQRPLHPTSFFPSKILDEIVTFAAEAAEKAGGYFSRTRW